MRRLLLALAAGLLCGVAHAGVWDTATPGSSDPVSQGDDRIREMKTAVQESLRGGAAEGNEAVFPGASPTTAPIFRYRGLKGTTAARPAASAGGLYFNTSRGALQRSDGSVWDDVGLSTAPLVALHDPAPANLASAAGVVTVPETGNSFDVTGTEAVTSFTGWTSGRFVAKWVSARIVSHSPNLYLAAASSRNVVANDVSVFEFVSAGVVREIGFNGAGAGVPVGGIQLHSGVAPPAGFLECNGASLLRADYPGLFAVIGSTHGAADATHFNLPDLRGKFARGWDHGAGNDPNAATRTAPTGGSGGDQVGSLQSEQVKNHAHTFSYFPTGGGAGAAQHVLGNGGTYTTATDGGGSETRPINVNLMFIIKF